MRRVNSTNISDQGLVEGTCYAHTATRIILNAVRQTIPGLFYPLDANNICDEFYDSELMLTVFNSSADAKCSDHSFNNLILYIYIYKIITKQFGCSMRGASVTKSIKYFIETFIYYSWGDDKMIKRIFKDFEGFDEPHVRRLFDICNAFIHKFVTIENNEFMIESFDITSSSDMKRLLRKLSDAKELDEKDSAINLIKHVIDNGYYISIRGRDHGMAIVNYDIREEDGEFVLIIKDSYGKNIYHSSVTNLLAKNGIFKMTIDEVIQRDLTQLSFIYPKYVTDEDKLRIEAEHNTERENLDEIDRKYRIKHKKSNAG